LHTEPGSEIKSTQHEVSRPFSRSLEDLRSKCFDAFGWVGSGWMHSCRAHRRTVGFPGSGAGFPWAGASCSSFDSIGGKIRVSSVSNCRERRQTKEAGLKCTMFPGSRARYNTKHFLYWNQAVAAKESYRSRQLEIMAECTEKAGSQVATLIPICASLLYGVFLKAHHIQDAVFMANPEV